MPGFGRGIGQPGSQTDQAVLPHSRPGRCRWTAARSLAGLGYKQMRTSAFWRPGSANSASPASWACRTGALCSGPGRGFAGDRWRVSFLADGVWAGTAPGGPARIGARPGSGRPWLWRLPRWPGAGL